MRISIFFATVLSVFMLMTSMHIEVFAASIPNNTISTLTNASAGACAGIAELSGNTQGCGTGGSSLKGAVRTTINILSYVLGVIAVIMIIIGGLRFVTSGGNQQSVSSAKTTIAYALLGLVVAALAQVLVHWVLNSSINVASSLINFQPLSLLILRHLVLI